MRSKGADFKGGPEFKGGMQEMQYQKTTVGANINLSMNYLPNQ